MRACNLRMTKKKKDVITYALFENIHIYTSLFVDNADGQDQSQSEISRRKFQVSDCEEKTRM